MTENDKALGARLAAVLDVAKDRWYVHLGAHLFESDPACMFCQEAERVEVELDIFIGEDGVVRPGDKYNFKLEPGRYVARLTRAE